MKKKRPFLWIIIFLNFFFIKIFANIFLVNGNSPRNPIVSVTNPGTKSRSPDNKIINPPTIFSIGALPLIISF